MSEFRRPEYSGDPIAESAHLRDLKLATALFSHRFSQAGYENIDPVPITSKIDPTVRFIGAPVSVFKSMLIGGNVPTPGSAMVQNCVRTANIATLFNPEIVPEYGTFFTAMGAVAPYEGMSNLFVLAQDYLLDDMSIDPDDLYISFRSSDLDIGSAANAADKIQKHPDGMPRDYYDHTYGMDNVRGRNSSFWLRNSTTGAFEDVGNIIVIEKNGGALGVEFAFGDTTLIKQIRGLRHIQDAYDLALAPSETTEAIRRKAEDAAITSLALFSEGLRPGARDNQTRILRSYIKALSMYRRMMRLECNELEQRMTPLEIGKLPFEASGQVKEVVDEVIDYEQRVRSKGPSNKEDVKILSILESAGLEQH